jgi:hypothetical protein
MTISEVWDASVDVTALQELVDRVSQLPTTEACSNTLWRCLDVAFQAASGVLSLTIEP